MKAFPKSETSEHPRTGGRGRSGLPAGILLTPGAGSDRDHPTLVHLEHRLSPIPVRRMDFPYRREGRRAPDRAPKLMASIDAEIDGWCAELGVGSDRLVLGGRSMGGRMCSMVAAERPTGGVVAISYPLHPPGRPDRLRVEHLVGLQVPVLFVSGTRDPFGTPDELAAAAELVPGPVTMHWVEGGRHDLKGADDEIADAVAAWLHAL